MAFTGDNSNGTSNHNHGTFYVAIDGRGWGYSASMGGTFVSRDNGSSFDALHMVMTPRRNAENATEWPVVNRVNHDYQGISTVFRGDGTAFPSDQGLGICDGNSNTLINAVGDMHNNMAMSALISPSKDGKSRNVVVNLKAWFQSQRQPEGLVPIPEVWDWNQAFTTSASTMAPRGEAGRHRRPTRVRVAKAAGGSRSGNRATFSCSTIRTGGTHPTAATISSGTPSRDPEAWV